MTLISTLSTMQKSLSNRQSIAGQDRAVQQAQKEVTTGLKSDIYGDGAFRAAQTLDMRNRMARSDAYAVSNQLLAGKLSVMSTALGNVRNSTQDFLSLMTSLSQGQGSDVLQSNAKAVLLQLSMQLNTPYAGEYIFSGQDGSGQSFVLEGASGFDIPGLEGFLSAGDLTSAKAAIDDFFSDSPTAEPNFFTQNYFGSTDLPNAQLDEGLATQYGFSVANKGMRDLLKGLAMLSTVDVSQFADSIARDSWIAQASAGLAKGLTALQTAETEVGNTEALLERMIERQQKLGEIYNNRIVDIEGVDPYEAATRLESLSTQLETSYAVTVRLKNLSLLNYLR